MNENVITLDPESLETATILVIDHDQDSIALLRDSLIPEGYSIVEANQAEDALTILTEDRIDMALIEIALPGMGGIELCQKIRAIPEKKHLPIIMVTQESGNSNRLAAKQAGCDDYLTKPLDLSELSTSVKNLLFTKLYHEHLENNNDQLEEMVRKRTATLRKALTKLQQVEREVRTSREEVVNRLSMAAEFRDDETGQHVERMSHYCLLLARKYGLEEDLCQRILLASRLHDVGKIGIPENILLKPGKLTAEEFEIIKTHATIGHRILDGSETPMLQMAAQIALTHHEKYDGSGYPKALVAEDIPLEGRICAIADVFDALTTDRIYKKAMPVEAALDIMKEGRGKHFDPVLHDIFLNNLDEVLLIRQRFPDDPPKDDDHKKDLLR